MSEVKVWYLPIEPYEERYTKGLDDWTHSEFQRLGVNYEAIYGDQLKSELDSGHVLDVEGRHVYCFGQLQKLLKKISSGEVKKGDKVFTTDFWFPGIEALAYVRNMRKNDLGLYGFVCSGSFEEYDFTHLNGMRPWAEHIERGWCNAYNKIFVANERMKQMVMARNIAPEEKIAITGLPANTNWILSKVKDKSEWKKENMVVFPHRWDSEKDPDFFVDVAEKVKEYDETVKFVVSTGRKKGLGTATSAEQRALKFMEVYRGLSKPQYYELLTRGKVVFSAAKQDTVGNAMIESITLGNTPVVVKGMYDDYLPSKFEYDRGNLDQAVELVLKYLEKPEDVSRTVKKFDRSLEHMIREMVE